MHVLIVGQSYSGKTNLAKALAHLFKSQGHNVGVFSPMRDGGWPQGAQCYSTIDSFFAAYWASESCYWFIDEAKVLFDKDLKQAEKLLYQGRHGGRLNFIIGQRSKGMIPPNARDQCSQVFAFKQKPHDAKYLAENFDDGVAASKDMEKLHFVWSDPYTSRKGHLEFNGDSKVPKIIYD